MTGLSDAESPQLADIVDSNVELNGGPNTATTRSATMSPSLEEKEHTPVVLLHRSILRGSRRNSSQMPSGVVHPVAKGAEEVANRARKRSVSSRGIAGTPSSSVAAWSTVTSVLRRSVSDMQAHSDLTNRRKASESPYEEMMERFQIRQLQRTPPTMEIGLEGLLGGAGVDFGGTASSARTGRTPRQEHHLLPRLSARNVSEHASTPDANTRKASFLNLGDVNSSFEVGRPPLESGTSSLQLTEQYNLAYGTPFYQSSARNYLLACVERLLQKLARPISPFSKISQARYAVTLMTTVVYIVWFPLELAFHEKYHIATADTAIGVLLGLNVVLTLHTGYMTETGKIVVSHWQIFGHYMKTRFVIDALISVPLLVHSNTMNNSIPGGKWVLFLLDVLSVERLAYMMRIVRVIWLIRANQSGGSHNFWAWLLYSRYSHLFRIAGIVAILVCIAHYIACIWAILLEENETFEESFESWRDVYSGSFYAALLLLQGEGVPTNSAGQNLFASLSVIVGSIVLAVVFGHVAILVSNFNANTTSYQRKMEEVFAMTAKLQLPAPLRERIHEYYEHLWHEYECLDGEIVQFSKELSHTLGLEVVLFKYMEVVMHVPFWKDCTPDFQKQLMLRLDVRVYLPNDFIMREGEVDVEFYMVNRGHCEIGRDKNRFERVTTSTITAGGPSNGGFSIGRSNSGMGVRRRNGPTNGDQSSDGSRQSAYELDAAQRRYYRTGGRGGKGHDVLISRGQAFGDMALLMNYQRAANVRAVTHVEMCVLSREDFQVVLARYPEDRRRVVVEMLASYMQSYELVKSRCPLLELVRKVYSPEAIAEACAKSGGHPPLIPPVLSARQAAERIYTAMNVETNDGTLKFGVGVNIRDQLVDLRDKLQKKRGRKQQAKASAAGPPSYDSRSRRGSDDRIRTESTSGKRVVVEPVQSTADASVAHESAQSTLSPSLLERLKQAEEREIVIVQALQELKASLKILQARQVTPIVSPRRKRSALGNDATIPKRATGVPLVKRMGSFVGLASGSTLESKPTGGQASKRSPTRYADELFSQGSSTASERSSFHELHHPVRRQRQPSSRQEASFTFSSEIESHLSTVENSPFDQQPAKAPTPQAATKYKMSDQQRASTKSLTSAPPEENQQQRMHFQRLPSQSMRKLQGASRARADSASSTKAVAGEQARRGTFQRTHSQSMRALTEALAAHAAPRGSLSNAQSRVLKRMSSFVSDTSGSSNSKRSPTRYADALFRRKSIELSKDEDWESDKPA